MEALRRGDERVGERGARLAPDDLQVLAKVVASAAAVDAAVVDQIGFEQHRVAGAEAGDPLADCVHAASRLVTGHHREVDERMLVGESVQIGAADADRLRAHAQLAATWVRQGPVLDAQLARRRQHHLTHAVSFAAAVPTQRLFPRRRPRKRDPGQA